ncbi:alpha/beta fold hydrolase [Isoptericola sp. BMS4]|uniref:alpha/beta fold hydrolase n=1 Tax=Isoptericola sp. BMS4 TaxID=2527875 RepID=UPI0014205D42|nr:alpha/beta hydrolase [Isoptericola sp. BMS4]
MRTQELQRLTRPEGRIAYTDTGSGPLVVAVPGMGDLRSTYDDLAPALVDAGYRVVVTDLRGHGDSDTTFTTHGDVATGTDLVALVEHLDAGPAVLVGSSMGGSAAVWAAAERPDLVRGLVLVAPHLRETASPAQARTYRLLYRALFARPWGAAAWAWLYTSMFAKGRRSARHAQHVADIRRSMADPARLRSFRDLAVALDHTVIEPLVPRVQAPALVVGGELDPDYDDAGAELDRMRDALGGAGLLVPGVGHYPQHQAPEAVTPSVLEFLAGLPAPSPEGGERA